MKFDKNKDEIKNINILKKEIKKIKSPYSNILIESLLTSTSAEEFRNSIKENVTKHIEDSIKK